MIFHFIHFRKFNLKKITDKKKPQDEDDNPAVRMHQMETSCGKLFMLLDRKEFPKEVCSFYKINFTYVKTNISMIDFKKINCYKT